MVKPTELLFASSWLVPLAKELGVSKFAFGSYQEFCKDMVVSREMLDAIGSVIEVTTGDQSVDSFAGWGECSLRFDSLRGDLWSQ